MLTEEKIQCIEYLVQGVTKTEIAKLIGKSRNAIYLWLEDGEFKSELNKRIQERKTEAKSKLNTKLPQAIDKVWYLIENAESDKVKGDLLKYWIDREMGTPTSMTKDLTEIVEAKEVVVDLDNLATDIETE